MNNEEETKVNDIKQEDKKSKKSNKKVNEEIELLKNQNALLNEKLLRVIADSQNMKKRSEEEIAKLCKYDGESVIKEILTVVDNFERAININEDNLSEELSKFLSGFKMIYANLINILDSKGVKEIKCLNETFDPNKMDAMLTEKKENTESGIVIEVLQKGYMYNDKIIRPAMVKVSE